MHAIFKTATAAAFAFLPLAAQSEQGQFDSDGVEIQFTDEGTGPAVVYLHAFAGNSSLWTSAGLAPLDGYRTITYDARGHGASDAPSAANAYGLHMVSDLARLLDDLGLEEAHIVGYSMGAETALRFAALYPDRVTSLVVAGSGWSGEVQAGTYGYISQALAGSASFGDFMAAMAAAGEDAPAVEEQAAEEQAAMMGLLSAHGIKLDQPTDALAGVAAGMSEIINLSANDLARFDFPVLGLAGETDEERVTVEALAGGLDDFRFVVVPGADHLAAPLSLVFGETVADFLAE